MRPVELAGRVLCVLGAVLCVPRVMLSMLCAVLCVLRAVLGAGIWAVLVAMGVRSAGRAVGVVGVVGAVRTMGSLAESAR